MYLTACICAVSYILCVCVCDLCSIVFYSAAFCFHLLCVCACAGHYCPEGSPSPVQCPPGTNTTSVGLRSVGDCESCVKGYYCPSNGTVLSEKKCLAGKYIYMCMWGGGSSLSSCMCLDIYFVYIVLCVHVV